MNLNKVNRLSNCRSGSSFRYAFFALLGLLAGSAYADKSAVPHELCFRKQKICTEMSWVKAPKKVEMPTEEDMSEFLLKFYKEEKGKKVFVSPKHSVSVSLFMPSMGHGSHPTTVTPVKDKEGKPQAGEFDVKNVLFSMPGEWEIRIVLKDGDKKVDEVVIPYVL